MRNQKTRIMVEAALLVALAVVLNFIKIQPWPQGGSITCAAMAPIVLLSLRRGWKWGLLGAFAYSLLQMLLDRILVPAGQGIYQYVMAVALDYIVAYTVLGLASIFAKPFGDKRYAPLVGSVAVTLLRYLCHFGSGILIWGAYAPDTMPVWIYSLTYNGSYMIPETIITAVAVTLLYPVLQQKAKVKA